MNSYATIEEDGIYKVIGYYSLKSEDKGYTESEDFFSRMEDIPEIQDQLLRFVYWFEKIGDEGLRDGAFRNEGLCVALPPEIKFSHELIELRLYCHVLTNNIVILFNGDRKTAGARRSQDCPRVHRHHENAIGWTKKIMRETFINSGNVILNKEEISIIY